jgi:EF hand
MRRLRSAAVLCVIAGSSTQFVVAQPSGPPPSPLIRALDANNDGELSADEIAKAPAALKTLDQNGDGKLDQSETGPQFGRGGRRGPGGTEGFRPMRGGRSAMSVDETLKRYLTMDKNGDGQLTRDEVPDRMAGLVTRADSNEDGVIAKDELEQMVKKEAGR